MTIEEMREHEWVISWSGGKDSTATIILCHIHKIPIKKIVYVRMMWDDKLPATLPIMTEFVDRAKEVFERWGYPVEVIPSIVTAKEITEKKYFRSKKYPYKNGKYYGVTNFMRGFCTFTGVKQATIATLSKEDYEMIGYASDEKERIGRLTATKQSIMVALGVTEQMALYICKRHDLLSPLYDLDISRDGCWFCPNAGRRERELLKEQYPELVSEIKHMIEMCDYDITNLIPRNNWLQDYYKGEL